MLPPPYVDECAVTNGHCEHNCTNEPGGYSCQPGYQLHIDGHTCVGQSLTVTR
uniref:EGF-like calcium-binding domain-containing protein n=1 Tax=Amphiprion percula TaxID=161767 RepID=A0A3P8UFA6_AMPPE